MNKLLDLGYKLTENNTEYGHMAFTKVFKDEDNEDIERTIMFNTTDNTYTAFDFDLESDIYDGTKNAWLTLDELNAILTVLNNLKEEK